MCNAGKPTAYGKVRAEGYRRLQAVSSLYYLQAEQKNVDMQSLVGLSWVAVGATIFVTFTGKFCM